MLGARSRLCSCWALCLGVSVALSPCLPLLVSRKCLSQLSRHRCLLPAAFRLSHDWNHDLVSQVRPLYLTCHHLPQLQHETWPMWVLSNH